MRCGCMQCLVLDCCVVCGIACFGMLLWSCVYYLRLERVMCVVGYGMTCVDVLLCVRVWYFVADCGIECLCVMSGVWVCDWVCVCSLMCVCIIRCLTVAFWVFVCGIWMFGCVIVCSVVVVGVCACGVRCIMCVSGCIIAVGIRLRGFVMCVGVLFVCV